VRGVIYPIKERDGSIREVVLIHEDITTRKRAEDALRMLVEASSILASSLEYDTTLASVAQFLVPHLADYCMLHVLEADGQYRQVAAAHVNPAQAALLDELGRVYRVDFDNPHSLVTKALRTGESVLVADMPATLPKTMIPDAAVRRIYHALQPRSCMIVPLVAHGRVLGTLTCAALASSRRYSEADLALVEDLARRAAVAVENARLYRAAQAAIKTRDAFLSIAAHELKTPLTTLLGHTQAFQRRMARAQLLDERDQRVLGILEEQALRLNRQIDTLLDLTRIELGQFQLECQPMDLCRLAQRVVAELETTSERHTISLHRVEEALIVVGDEQRLEEVLQNLLQNAIKYSPHGGSVTIRIQQQEGQAAIAVSDEGIGIPADAHPHLFEPFYRASNTSAHLIMGTGIGLYIVKEIVTRHGGVVDVRSTEGRGSTFTIQLPLMAEKE
jgi:signal transduction histidine kinase